MMNNKKSDSGKPEHETESEQEDPARNLKPVEYLRALNVCLAKGDKKNAYTVAQQAFVMYPEDPFILSHYGCLQAGIDKKFRSGVDNCTKAIAMLKRKTGAGKEMLYPVMYLNLGRAYVAAGKKQHAVVAFKQGLQYDPEYTAIRKELQKFGIRKKPPVSFLDRSNIVNKYLGKILKRGK